LRPSSARQGELGSKNKANQNLKAQNKPALSKNKAEEKASLKSLNHTKRIIFKFYFIIFTFTHMCIHCLGQFPPNSPTSPPQLLDRTCSALLFSSFFEEKT
jgi:hypothetical protein